MSIKNNDLLNKLSRSKKEFVRNHFKSAPNSSFFVFQQILKILKLDANYVTKDQFEALRPKKVVKVKNSLESKQRLKPENSQLGLIKSVKHIGTFVTLLNVAFESAKKKVEPNDLDKLHRNRDIVPDFTALITQVVDYHNNLITNRGVHEGTSYYKKVTQFVIDLLERPGFPDESEHNNLMLSTGKKDKWPSALKGLRPLYHIQKSDVSPLSQACDQIIRSILAVNRSVSDYCELDIETITREGTYDMSVMNDFENHLKQRFIDLRFLNNPMEFPQVEMDIRTFSNGPNNVKRYMSADKEAFTLYKSPEWEDFKRLAELTNQTHLTLLIENISNRLESELTPKELQKIISNTLLFKITAVPDSGNKSRTIAIGNFWIQKLLEPIVHNIRAVTKQLHPETCAVMDQTRGFLNLKEHLRDGIKCYDATAWTDTFHADWQSAVLKPILGDEISALWFKLVCRAEFSISKKKKIRYTVGQGMGINGSFDIATLATQELLTYFYQKNYPTLWKDLQEAHMLQSLFSEVGDDLWVYDPEDLFLGFYQDQIGIPINLNKSKIASVSNKKAEFVSRNINFGKEVSRFSFRLCTETEKNYFQIPTLYNHVTERCDYIDKDLLIERLVEARKHKIKLLSRMILCGMLESIIMEEPTAITEVCLKMVRVIDSKRHIENFDHVSKILYGFKSQILYEEYNFTPQVAYLISLLNKVRNAVSELNLREEVNNCELHPSRFILRDPSLTSISLGFNKCLKTQLTDNLEKLVDLDVANSIENIAFGEDIDLVPLLRNLDNLYSSFSQFNKTERKEDPRRLMYKLHKLNGLLNTFSVVEDVPQVKIKTADWDRALIEFSTLLES